MFCINISWFVCTFVAVAIATDSTSENYISESATAEPVQQLKPSTGAALAAAEGARLAAHGSPEPPARTSSTALADSGSLPYPATEPHSNHSSCQSPATAAPTMSAETESGSDEDRMARFWKGRTQDEKVSRLMEAARLGDMRKLEALLAACVDVGARDWLGNATALHMAAGTGQEEAARWLLAAGAAVDARDNGQCTPLHDAARRGHAAVVRLLLAAGANLSARDHRGWTPLHWAAYFGKAEVVSELLEAGADRAARDKVGRTPLDLARRRVHHQVVQVVQLLEGDTSLTSTTLPN